MLINAVHFSTEFNDLCGLIKCKYEKIDDDQYDKFMSREVALDKDVFDKLMTDLEEKFVKEYF